MRRRLWALALAGLVFLATTGEATAGRVALVLGNAAYRHAPTLENTLNDATEVAGALRRLGFEVVEGLDLDRAATTLALRRFGRALEGAEVGLFFFAGHGLQVGGVNYIVPIDARLEDESDLLFEAVELQTVMRLLEQRPRTSLVFLDSCRDNPLARNLARGMGASRSTAIGRGLARVDGGIGTLIAYATQPDNVALDGTGRHSPFTQALLEHLEAPGLEVRQMLSRVRQDVVSTTGGRQVPWDHSSLTGDFYFVPAAATPEPPPAAAPAPPPSIDFAGQAELLFWQSVQDSREPADIEAYLARFPDGVFAALARSRLERLRRPEAVATPAPQPAPPPPPPQPEERVAARVVEPPAPPAPPAPVAALEVDPLGRELVALRNANVRARPNAESERVGFLPAGTAVQVTGRPRGADWYQVALADGGIGYVFGPLLGDAPPPPAPPPGPPAPPAAAVTAPAPPPRPAEPPTALPAPPERVAMAPVVVAPPPAARDPRARLPRLARPDPNANYILQGVQTGCEGAREFPRWSEIGPGEATISLGRPGLGGPSPGLVLEARSDRARAELAVFSGEEGFAAIEHNRLLLQTFGTNRWCDMAAAQMLRHFAYPREHGVSAEQGGSVYAGRFQFRFVPFRLVETEGGPHGCAAFHSVQADQRISGFACRAGEGSMGASELEGVLGALTVKHVLN